MVYISYSHKDKESANAVKMVLKKNGIDYWMDTDSITIGDDFSCAIHKAIEACDLFLIILSANSQVSNHVIKELDSAISYNKPIVPFQIDNESLTTPFDTMLSNIQRIEAFRDLEKSYDMLIALIRAEVCASSKIPQ